jgi:hypothetical protein
LNTRGIQLAKKCLLVAAVCYNLKRLLNRRGETKLKGGKTLIQHFVLLWATWVQKSSNSRFSWAVSSWKKQVPFPGSKGLKTVFEIANCSQILFHHRVAFTHRLGINPQGGYLFQQVFYLGSLLPSPFWLSDKTGSRKLCLTGHQL